MLRQALTSEPGIRSRLKELHYAQTPRGVPTTAGRPLSTTISSRPVSLSVTSDDLRLARPADLASTSLMAFSRPDFALALRSRRSPERSRTSAAARRTRRRSGVFDLLLSVTLVAHTISVPRGRVNCHHPSGLVTRVIRLGANCFGPSVAFAV
jgi:hypothetical protein